MVVVKRRGAVKKMGPITGQRIVLLRAHDKSRTFCIHADIACRTSDYLKKRLQPHRKEVKGECPICMEDLDPVKSDVSFCQDGCGQNMHSKCITKWRGQTKINSQCPTCRKVWKLQPVYDINLDKDADLVSLQIYVDWLYTSQIDLGEDDQDRSEKMLKAWDLALFFQDEEFRHAIIAKMISEDFEPSIGPIDYAFTVSSDKEMQNFMVDWSISVIEPDFFRDQSDAFPAAYVSALGDALIRERLEERISLESVLKKYTNGKYELR